MRFKKCTVPMKVFMQLGLNVADTLKYSSILINSHSEQSINTQCDRHDAVLIKAAIKKGAN
jgi:hypothetical protein